jgi:uncharacterized cupredoxin-like copper-binding protein
MNMRKVLGLVAAMAIVVAACGGSAASTAPAKSAAASQAAPASARTVELVIGVGKITPATVEVKKGETIIFNAKNDTTVEVELIVGTQADVDADAGDSLKEAEEIAPGTSKPVTYTFDTDGSFAYGDQIEDHYAKGAKGKIVFVP